jgi:hypothetical protein
MTSCAGLASTTAERTTAEAQIFEVTWVRITEAGRRMMLDAKARTIG